MRKLIIRLFAFSLYFKVLGRVVNIPRIVVSLCISFFFLVMFSSTSWGYTSNRLLSLLYFLPFIFTVSASFYLRAKPIKWLKDKDKMDFTQRFHFLGLLVEHKHQLDYRNLFYRYKEIFESRFGIYDYKFAVIGSMVVVYIYLFILGYLFYTIYI